jgi:uncharacterized OB-fold protein
MNGDEVFTGLEHERLDKNLCLKCGKHITTQEYYGSLCHDCNVLYFPIDAKHKEGTNTDAIFLAFIRDNKEKVVFT